jgi:hypothetical protein
MVLRVAVSAGLMWLLYRRIDLAHVRETFAQTRPGPVVVLYVLLLLNTVINAFKWKQLLKANDSNVPLIDLVGSYLAGNFLSLFLPSNIGGDAYRVYYVRQRGHRTAHSLASVLADRLSGFVVLVAFAFVFGLVGFARLPSPRVLWIPAIALLILVAAIGTLLHRQFALWCIERFIPARWVKLRNFGAQLLDAVDQYRRAPGVFARTISLSILFQFNACCCVWVLARCLGLDVAFTNFLVFVPFISLLEALPISIFGLGIRDNAYVYFFTTVGLAAAQAAAMALAYVVMTLIYSASGGLVLMFRRMPAPTT